MREHEHVSDIARLLKLLREPKSQESNLRLGSEEWADAERSALNCLLETHLPQHETAAVEPYELRICAEDRVRWASQYIRPLQGPGDRLHLPSVATEGARSTRVYPAKTFSSVPSI